MNKAQQKLVNSLNLARVLSQKGKLGGGIGTNYKTQKQIDIFL